jgi:hypothetical protein
MARDCYKKYRDMKTANTKGGKLTGVFREPDGAESGEGS